MAEEGRLARLMKQTARKAGRRYAEIRHSYEAGQRETAGDGGATTDGASDGASTPDPDSPVADHYDDAPPADTDYLPVDDEGRARLVCRRYAEKRAVAVDAQGRPPCFDPGHPDCQGCVEDVRDGRVETW